MNGESMWYFIVDDAEGRRQEGPVAGADLVAMLSAGEISTDTLVWHEGLTDWLPIEAVPEFSEPTPQVSSLQTPDSESMEPSSVAPSEDSEDTAKANEPSDTVTIKDTGNHSIQFSKSRNVLLIATNDYHAGPLELTKLDLLGFLVAMETSTPRGEADK